MIFGLVSYSLTAKWYVIPYLASLSPAFAYPAAYGDLLAAILALSALMALRFRWAIAYLWFGFLTLKVR